MQAELTTLKGQFQLAPNLKKTAGANDDDKEGGKKQGGGDNKKKKNKKNNANKEEQKKDEKWKKTPPKKGEAHEKKVKGGPGICASTTWHGETTRNQTANLAKTAPTSRMVALTKSRPKPPWQLPSIPSGRL